MKIKMEDILTLEHAEMLIYEENCTSVGGPIKYVERRYKNGKNI